MKHNLREEAKRLAEDLRKQQETNTIEEARRLVMKKLAEKQAERERKRQEREAWLKEYHEQLDKGTSNRNVGSKKSRRVRARPAVPSPFQRPGQ